VSAIPVIDCWKRIGAWGDRSCEELKTHVHCRNCPVYSVGAAILLDAEVSESSLAENARLYAQVQEHVKPGARSVMIFRLATEWLALPTTVFLGVAPIRPLHSLPHRRDHVVTGITSVRGELLVCVSLTAALGIAGAQASGASARFAVVSREGDRFVFAADEIAELRRFDDSDLSPVPATLAHALAKYTRGMLAWREQSVGVLDDQLLFYSLNRRLA